MKSLILYYSHSGNTRRLAELIALNPQIKNPNLIRVGDEVRVQ